MNSKIIYSVVLTTYLSIWKINFPKNNSTPIFLRNRSISKYLNSSYLEEEKNIFMLLPDSINPKKFSVRIDLSIYLGTT